MRGCPDGMFDMYVAPYVCRRDELSVQCGCVLWGAREISLQCRQYMLYEVRLAHPGISGMNKESRTQLCLVANHGLNEMVQKCDTCQLHNKSSPAAPLIPWEWPEKPWTRIDIDYTGPFLDVPCSSGCYIKVIVTHITNSITSTATVCKLREILAQHGLPET